MDRDPYAFWDALLIGEPADLARNEVVCGRFWKRQQSGVVIGISIDPRDEGGFEVRVGKGSPFTLTTDAQIEDFCEGTLSWICRQPVSHEDYAAWWSAGQWRDGALIDRKPPKPSRRKAAAAPVEPKLDTPTELHGYYGNSKVIPRAEVDQGEVLAADQVLVGLNKSRITYNDRLRALKGMPEREPVVGDKLVALRNNREKKILNGGLWQVEEITETKPIGIKMLVTSEDSPEHKATEVFVRHEFFQGTYEHLSWEKRRYSDEFTFGYALTVHKSQGSQWDNVYLFDESGGFRDHRERWLYTGITRAAERVTVVA